MRKIGQPLSHTAGRCLPRIPPMQETSYSSPDCLAVRHVRGGPVMTVEGGVEHLLLCVWIDELGRARRQTFSPDELVIDDAVNLTWVRTLVRLASRWPVAAALC